MNIFCFVGSAHINCLLPTAYFSLCLFLKKVDSHFASALKKVQVKLDFLLAFS